MTTTSRVAVITGASSGIGEATAQALTGSAGGDVINISSVAGRTARAGNGVYAATKWGVNGSPTARPRRRSGAMYNDATVTGEFIAFAIARPRHLAINEILLRPADQI